VSIRSTKPKQASDGPVRASDLGKSLAKTSKR
jgi:hypothetical protein